VRHRVNMAHPQLAPSALGYTAAWPRACCATVAGARAAVAPSDAGFGEHERGIEGSEKEAVVLAVKCKDG
jgi:hypothetical protein